MSRSQATARTSLPSLRTALARAARHGLIEREVRERVSDVALDLMFAAARVLSEGSLVRALPRSDGAAAPDPYFGSTMLSVALDDLAAEIRETPDERLAGRVATLLTGDARFGRRVRALAAAEAARIAGAPLVTRGVEIRVRAEGCSVLVDVDFEGAREEAAAVARADRR